MKEKHMRLKLTWSGTLIALFLAFAGSGYAKDISGTIATTLTITDNSRLVGDVTCIVVGTPCIAFGASGLTLDLNGYSVTGLGNAVTGCVGNGTAGEFGIDVNGVNNVIIRGLGLIQQFRNSGIRVNNSTDAMVSGVTMSTNCFAGIILIGGSGHVVENNVSVRNGNPGVPCGGI
jgi:hypothetical protein